MKSFLEFLIEMSVTDAMKMFGLKEVPSTKEELNKHFKKLALKHHPDLGGSEETMKLLNQAKELLDKNLGKSAKSGKVAGQKSEYDIQMEHVKEVIRETLSRFDETLYKDYLDKAFGISFNVKKEFNQFSNLIMEFSDKERDKVFELTFYVDEHKAYNQIYNTKSINGVSDRTFDVGMYSFVFIDNKKQVLTKDRFMKVSDAKIFTDPTILLPKTKISKLSKGEVRKNSNLAKRDFEALFKAKYNADIDGRGQQTYYFIPVHNGEYIICIYRVSTFKCYILHEIGKKPKSSWKRYDDFISSNKISFVSFQENEDGMEFIKKALADFDKTGDYQKFIKEYTEYYDKRMEEIKSRLSK